MKDATNGTVLFVALESKEVEKFESCILSATKRTIPFVALN